jgi:hypothetical protein
VAAKETEVSPCASVPQTASKSGAAASGCGERLDWLAVLGIEQLEVEVEISARHALCEPYEIGAESVRRGSGALVEASGNEQQTDAALGGQPEVRGELIPVSESGCQPDPLRNAFAESCEVGSGACYQDQRDGAIGIACHQVDA